MLPHGEPSLEKNGKTILTKSSETLFKGYVAKVVETYSIAKNKVVADFCLTYISFVLGDTVNFKNMGNTCQQKWNGLKRDMYVLTIFNQNHAVI